MSVGEAFEVYAMSGLGLGIVLVAPWLSAIWTWRWAQRTGRRPLLRSIFAFIVGGWGGFFLIGLVAGLVERSR